MKYQLTLLLLLFLFNATANGQHYSFRYNPYSGMNKDQLSLALEQAKKMERNGKVWTAVGTGMLVGGAVMTFNGLGNATDAARFNYGTFGAGLGIMCFSGFPLGYGLYAWISGRERANMIEIELLALNPGSLKLAPTPSGIGLVLKF